MGETTYLAVKVTTSRGAETYGYNIVTLTDSATGKRFRCMGGGYDMTGTVFGEWLETTHQDALRRIAHRAHQTVITTQMRPWDRTTNELPDALYGMTHRTTSKMTASSVTLDGACGLDCMRRIAEAIGLTVQAGERDRNGNARGYIVTSA